MFICLRFRDSFTTFIPVTKRFRYDRAATYNRLKKGGVE